MLGRQEVACMDNGVRRAGGSHCVQDSWMDGKCEEAACEPGRKLPGMGCEQGGLWEGTMQDIPYAQIEKYFIPPCEPEGATWCYLLPWMQQHSLLLVLSRTIQDVRTACDLGYTVLPQPRSLPKYRSRIKPCLCL